MAVNLNLATDLQLLKMHGRVEVVGNKGAALATFAPFELIGKATSIHGQFLTLSDRLPGVYVSDNTYEERIKIATDINKMFEATKARPMISKVSTAFEATA